MTGNVPVVATEGVVSIVKSTPAISPDESTVDVAEAILPPMSLNPVAAS